MPQHNKGHKQNTYCHHHIQWVKSKSLSLKIRNKKRVSNFTTLTQHCTGSSSHSEQTRRRNKRHPNWKGESKTVIILRRHDIVHRKPYSLHQKATLSNK